MCAPTLLQCHLICCWEYHIELLTQSHQSCTITSLICPLSTKPELTNSQVAGGHIPCRLQSLGLHESSSTDCGSPHGCPPQPWTRPWCAGSLVLPLPFPSPSICTVWEAWLSLPSWLHMPPKQPFLIQLCGQPIPLPQYRQLGFTLLLIQHHLLFSHICTFIVGILAPAFLAVLVAWPLLFLSTQNMYPDPPLCAPVGHHKPFLLHCSISRRKEEKAGGGQENPKNSLAMAGRQWWPCQKPLGWLLNL